MKGSYKTNSSVIRLSFHSDLSFFEPEIHPLGSELPVVVHPLGHITKIAGICRGLMIPVNCQNDKNHTIQNGFWAVYYNVMTIS